VDSLSLNDPRWSSLCDAYGRPLDTTWILPAIKSSDFARKDWDRVWSELHHQGDIGDAAYAVAAASVLYLAPRASADWNLFAFLLTVEYARRSDRAPCIPDWVDRAYADAWERLSPLAIEAFRSTEDPLVIRMALAIVATSKGLFQIGRLLSECDESEIAEFHENIFGQASP
jgi:hypothetical protein